MPIPLQRRAPCTPTAARTAITALLSACAAALFPQDAGAQRYPEKPIRFVVPVAAGGSADQFSRLIAQKLTASLGQTVAVDNRPGANGIIGTDLVAKAAPDGYTLLLGATPTLAINVTLYAGKMTYHPERDFTPIALVARITPVVAVHPSVPARSLKELIALARARPGKLSFGSSGVGSGNHLVGEMIKNDARVDMVHVPYGGGAPALVALLSGQIEILITPPPTLLPMIKAGRVRPLAVSSATRNPALPDVPTIEESGFPGFEASSWYVVAAPAGTPQAVITRLHGALGAILTSPDYRERLAAEGATADVSTPEEAAAFVRAEIPKWARVVRSLGTKVE
jgi:tripartite-type tricarboxylate transporter receptor subunit TctC